MPKYNQPARPLPDVSDLPTPRPMVRRVYDRPFVVNGCDMSTLDEDGDVLVSIHLMPRSVDEDMKVILNHPGGSSPGTVTDVDRLYGLVAVRLDG